MITLEKSEYFEFHKLNQSLFYYAGISENVIEIMDFFDFLKLSIEERFKCREVLISKPELIAEFLALNRQNLSVGEIKIVKDFMRRITGTFVVVGYEKNHAVFIDSKDTNMYAVKALTDPFQDLLPALPVMVTTTIMPFKNKIVYDGYMFTSEQLEDNFKNEFMTGYFEALKVKKIITTY